MTSRGDINELELNDTFVVHLLLTEITNVFKGFF